MEKDYDFARSLFRMTRLDHGLTQDEMAALLEITRIHVNRIENGHCRLSCATARRFMRAFAMSEEELYQEDA